MPAVAANVVRTFHLTAISAFCVCFNTKSLVAATHATTGRRSLSLRDGHGSLPLTGLHIRLLQPHSAASSQRNLTNSPPPQTTVFRRAALADRTPACKRSMSFRHYSFGFLYQEATPLATLSLFFLKFFQRSKGTFFCCRTLFIQFII